MKNSAIEWTHHTFNPWIGCTKVSPACDNCYASVSTPARTMKIEWGAGQPRKRTTEANWREPLRWNADCARRGVRARVFCASLADVFDNEVAVQWRIELMKLICETPHLDWLLLTKRIGNASRMLETAFRAVHHQREGWSDNTLPNVWIGATICNQEEAKRDIPKLLAVPAAKRFLSIEPLLGPINLWLPTRKWAGGAGRVQCNHCCNGDRCDDPTHHERGRLEWEIRCPYCRGTGRGQPIDWVIVGGESGPNARPMHPDWARSLRDQCQAARTPFFFKQWGEWTPGVNVTAQSGVAHTATWFANDWTFGREDLSSCDNHIDDEPDLYRIGKKAAGRQLDGREWNEVPA